MRKMQTQDPHLPVRETDPNNWEPEKNNNNWEPVRPSGGTMDVSEFPSEVQEQAL